MTLAIPTIPNLYAGYIVQPADLNNLAAAATFLLGKPLAVIQDVTAGHAITAAFAAVPMIGVTNINTGGSGQVDTDGMFSTGHNTRLTVATPGWFKFRYSISTLPSAGQVWCITYGQVTTGSNNPLGGGLMQKFWSGYAVYNGTNQTSVSSGGLWPAFLYAGDYFEVYAAVDATATTATTTSNTASLLQAEYVSIT